MYRPFRRQIGSNEKLKAKDSKYVHSLPPAAHDVGQQRQQDEAQHQGHDHRHQVVREEVPAGGGLGGVEHPPVLQDSGAHGGGRGAGLRTREVKLRCEKKRETGTEDEFMVRLQNKGCGELYVEK